MGSKWDEYRLEDITQCIVDCPHSTPLWTSSGVIVLRNQNIRNGKLNLESPSYTTKEGYLSRIKRAKPTEGDIVFTREAPMGEVCKIPKSLECCLGQRMVLVRADEKKVFADYLLYAFQSAKVKHQIGWNEGTGTTVSNVRIPNIKALKFCLPPLEEQKRIAAILSAFDNKITLNQEMNKTLEAMAQALFKSWFVDFEPFGGVMPNDWREGTLGEIARLDTTSAKPFKAQELLWEHYSIPAFDNNNNPVFEYGSEIKSGKYKVKKNAILASKLNPQTERTWWVDVKNEDVAICSTEFMQFIPVESGFRSFVYELIKSDGFQQSMCEHVTGSTGSRQRAQPKQIAQLDVLIPTLDSMNKFSEICLPIHEQQAKNLQNNVELAKLRDALLPKLINGEIKL